MDPDDQAQDANVLLDLMRCTTRSEFEKMCASVTLSYSDFGNMVWSAMVADTLGHHRVNRKLLPPELEITDEVLVKMNPLANPSKFGTRLSQIFRHPRELIAHFFYMGDGVRWWLVVFNYLDISRRFLHWKEGTHVHMLSYLTHPRATPNDFLEDIMWADKPRLPHPIHLRFKPRESDPMPPPSAMRGDSPSIGSPAKFV